MIKNVSYLFPYLRKYKWKYIAGAFFVIFTNIFRILNPRLVQQAIDLLKSHFSLGQLAIYAGGIVLVAIFEGFFLFMMRKSMIVASREIEFDLRNDFFRKLTELHAEFYQQMPTGDIMSRATNDLNAVRSMVGPGIAYSVNTIVAFLFVIPMMLIISPRLTFLVLLPFPLMAVLVNRFGKVIYKRFEKIQAQFAALSTSVQENLSGILIVKWFTRQNHEVNKFRELNKEYMRRNLHYVKAYAAFQPLLMLIIGSATALVILFGGQLVIRDVITLGEFTAFMLYLGMLIWPSIALGWVIGLFQQGAASLKRMREILESEPEIRELPHHLKPTRLKGEIQFDQLTFGYRPDTPVLKGISLRILPRQTIGIIGPTGSGKTTLVKLILHIYQLERGMLLIDGMDINDISPRVLRQRIGYVSQEPFLFSDTIRNNIAYGKPDASLEEIQWAARMAHIHEEILSFPDQYDSLLGEKGLNLSGGQKQRVAIARAILRNPDILILDDAFSALDTYTEEQILSNLDKFFPDRTVLLVSHRVSTLQNSDFIVVLEDGEIIEKGTHKALIEQEGLYAWIHQKQLLEAELEQVD